MQDTCREEEWRREYEISSKAMILQSLITTRITEKIIAKYKKFLKSRLWAHVLFRVLEITIFRPGSNVEFLGA